ncbi:MULTISPECIES: hypothetical protein [Acidovorax]|uniref:Uncharacterized protein n=1 Tax=Acidovorax soli TaxID=592050 RepID=A0A1H4B2V6_9BURK|nr:MULTISPECIES: hypothetical protein [Acidovorax]SEA42480.1 hypothetical protein SAMN05421875_11285 [Acidovorax soli]
MGAKSLSAGDLRAALVSMVLEWERRYGVAPSATSAISEHDAALLVGHTPESFSLDCIGRTAVRRGTDFCLRGVRYQVKACRPSGKPGSFVTWVPKARNYEWDRLIWILYDREFRILEAWEWTVEEYRSAFDTVNRLSPALMREGRALHAAAHETQPPDNDPKGEEHVPSAICFIERMRKQRRIDPNGSEWESGDWDVAEAKAALLIGKRIYFHEKQAEESYFGGTITGYRVLPMDHPATPGRIVFSFTPDAAGRGFSAGSNGWRFEQKTIP